MEDAFILVTWDTTTTTNNDTDVTSENCAPCSICTTKINDVFIDEASHIYIAIPIYNFIKYSESYSDTPGSLWQFKRGEVPNNNANLTIDNCQSFKYKAAAVGKTADTVTETNSYVKTQKMLFH